MYVQHTMYSVIFELQTCPQLSRPNVGSCQPTPEGFSSHQQAAHSCSQDHKGSPSLKLQLHTQDVPVGRFASPAILQNCSGLIQDSHQVRCDYNTEVLAVVQSYYVNVARSKTLLILRVPCPTWFFGASRRT